VFFKQKLERCAGTSAHDGAFGVSPSLWEVRLGLGWTMAEGVNGVTPSLGLETINITPFME